MLSSATMKSDSVRLRYDAKLCVPVRRRDSAGWCFRCRGVAQCPSGRLSHVVKHIVFVTTSFLICFSDTYNNADFQFLLSMSLAILLRRFNMFIDVTLVFKFCLLFYYCFCIRNRAMILWSIRSFCLQHFV